MRWPDAEQAAEPDAERGVSGADAEQAVEPDTEQIVSGAKASLKTNNQKIFRKNQ